MPAGGPAGGCVRCPTAHRHNHSLQGVCANLAGIQHEPVQSVYMMQNVKSRAPSKSSKVIEEEKQEEDNDDDNEKMQDE